MLFIFAYPSESDTSRYYLGGLFVLAALAGYGGLGLAALPMPARAAAALAGAILVAVTVGGDVARGVDLFSQPTDPGATPFVNRVVFATPADAIVIAPWLYATPLGYAAYVERRLGDRIVVTADPHEDEAYFRAWLRKRPVFVLSDEKNETFPGVAAHLVGVGSPNIYALR
jgi:hypothetical protein